MEGKKKIKVRTMDVILVIVAVALLAFTLEMIAIFRETGTIPDTLCTCVFAALAGECGAMAWIKTAKERAAERKMQLQDRAREERQQRENATNEEATT